MAPKDDMVYMCTKCAKGTSWIISTRLAQQPKCKYCNTAWPKKATKREPKKKREVAIQEAPRPQRQKSGKPPWRSEQENKDGVPAAVRTLYENLSKSGDPGDKAAVAAILKCHPTLQAQPAEAVPLAIRKLYETLSKSGDKADKTAMAAILKCHPSLRAAVAEKPDSRTLLGKMADLDAKKQAQVLKVYKLSEETKKANAQLVALCTQIEETRTALTVSLAQSQGIVAEDFATCVKAYHNASEKDVECWPPGEKTEMEKMHSEWAAAAKIAEEKHRLFVQRGRHLQALRPSGANRLQPYGAARPSGPVMGYGTGELLPGVAEAEAAEAAAATAADGATQATQEYAKGTGKPIGQVPAGTVSPSTPPAATAAAAEVAPGGEEEENDDDLDEDGDHGMVAVGGDGDDAEAAKHEAMDQILADATKAAKDAREALSHS